MHLPNAGTSETRNGVAPAGLTYAKVVGCQSGVANSPETKDDDRTATSSKPNSFMVRRLEINASLSFRVKAILSPPGDQAGSLPSATRVRPVPVAFIVQMPPSAAKASLLPSEDQFGPNSAEAGVFVMFTSPLPSAFIV